MDKKNTIIIPVYNEEKNLGHVLNRIKLNLSDIDVVVVNDASEDSTKKVAVDNNVNVINLPFNLGIGGAVQTGLKYASEHNYGYAVRIDGDGQHPVEEIKKLIDCLSSNENMDVVIGSRYNSNYEYKGSKIRRFATGFLSTIVSIITGQKFTDVTSGFFALKKNAINFLAHYYPEDYPEVESIILLKQNGFKIKEIPVSMSMRYAGTSSINFFESIYYMIRVILGVLIFSIEKLKNTGDKNG